MTKIKIKDWIIKAATQINPTSEFSYLEVQVILSLVLQESRAWLASHPEYNLAEDDLEKANGLLKQIASGVPLPYLTGKQAFFGLDFCVNPDVLIPRPETELLVEECIQWLEDHPSKRTMVDIGTGSGNIVITLVDRFEKLQATAIDISEKALEVARMNAAFYHVAHKITFKRNNLLEGQTQQFHLIAANLPYIPTDKLKTLSVYTHEPSCALDGGADGLMFIQSLLNQCNANIQPKGLIILEIQFDQSEPVLKMAETFFPGSTITVVKDLAMHPRIIKIQL